MYMNPTQHSCKGIISTSCWFVPAGCYVRGWQAIRAGGQHYLLPGDHAKGRRHCGVQRRVEGYSFSMRRFRGRRTTSLAPRKLCVARFQPLHRRKERRRDGKPYENGCVALLWLRYVIDATVNLMRTAAWCFLSQESHRCEGKA